MRVCQESNSPIGTRDAAAVACLSTGLRRGEVVALDYRDCDWETRGLFVKGKGKKYRQTYLRPGSLELLENWVSLRGRRSGALFYQCQWWGEIVPKRITSDALAIRLQEWGKLTRGT